MEESWLRKKLYIVLPVSYGDWEPDKVEPYVVMARTGAQAAAAYGAVYLQRAEDVGADEHAPLYPYVYKVLLSPEEIKTIFDGWDMEQVLGGGAMIVSPHSDAGREVIEVVKWYVLTRKKGWEESDD